MAVDEKVAESICVTTTADPAAVLAAADRAAAFAKSIDFKVARHGEAHDTGAMFVVKAAFGGQHLTFSVDIGAPDIDGRREVSTQIHRYSTSQQKLFALVPVGPKNVVGLRNYRRFMSALEAEVAGL